MPDVNIKQAQTVKVLLEAQNVCKQLGAVPALIIAVNPDATNGDDTFLIRCTSDLDIKNVVDFMTNIVNKLKQVDISNT